MISENIARRDVLAGLGVAAAGLAFGSVLQGGLCANAALAGEAQNAGRDRFLNGATILDTYVEDTGNWDYVLGNVKVKASNGSHLKSDVSMEMGGITYRNGVALLDPANDVEYSITFKPPANYEGFSAVLGNIDGTLANTTRIAFYLDDRYIDECVIEPNGIPHMFAIQITGAQEVKIVTTTQNGTNVGIAEMRLHQSMDFLAGMPNHRIPSDLPSNLVLPDGDYEATVDSNGEQTIVRVSVADNTIVSLSMESASGSASVSALAQAFAEILMNYGVPVQPQQEPVAQGIVTTLIG